MSSPPGAKSQETAVARDRLGADFAAGRPSRGPETMYVFPISACDARCAFCPQYVLPGDLLAAAGGYFYEQGHVLPFDTFSRLARSLARLGGVREVLFAGGEPLLHRRLPDFIRFANKTLGRRVCGVTSSGLSMLRRGREILDAEPFGVSVSINAGTEATYRAINRTARPGDFQRLIEGMRQLTALRPTRERTRFRFSAVVTRGVAREVHDIFRLAVECRVDVLAFLRLQTYAVNGRAAYDDLAPTAENHRLFLDDLADVSDTSRDHGIEIEYCGAGDDRGVRNTRAHFDQNPCVIGFLASAVTAEGFIRPCCSSRLVLGDLNREEFEDIWLGPRYAEFRRLGALTPSGARPPDSWCDECLNYEDNLPGAGLATPAWAATATAPRDAVSHLLPLPRR
ncbi:MAG: radical SAM protein [Planctomycetes bacterium]|nr:radical SAM protein [Planctomycetota bacterium]